MPLILAYKTSLSSCFRAFMSFPCTSPSPASSQLRGLAPDDCLVIEDSPAGIRAGKAAGCTVLGYTGSSIRQDVSAADFALSDFHLYRQLPPFRNLSPF